MALGSVQKAATEAIRILKKSVFQTFYEAWKIRWADFFGVRDTF
jgi:hypothetical protein